VVAKVPAPVPFLSEEEDQETVETEESEEAFFFASSAPAAAVNGSAPSPAKAKEVIPEPAFDSGFGSGFGSGFPSPEPELVAAAARPKFAELAEEPSYTPLPRDYASDFGSGVRGSAETEEHRAQPATALFTESNEESQRDLDTPTFLRRFRF
jgi:hypothetical protein